MRPNDEQRESARLIAAEFRRLERQGGQVDQAAIMLAEFLAMRDRLVRDLALGVDRLFREQPSKLPADGDPVLVRQVVEQRMRAQHDLQTVADRVLRGERREGDPLLTFDPEVTK